MPSPGLEDLSHLPWPPQPLEPSDVGHGLALAVLECMVAKSSFDHPKTVFYLGTTLSSSLPENAYPFFCRSIIVGLVPPFLPFFMAVLDHYGIQPLHLRPDSYLLLVIFAFYCEGFWGSSPLWRFFAASSL